MRRSPRVPAGPAAKVLMLPNVPTTASRRSLPFALAVALVLGAGMAPDTSSAAPIERARYLMGTLCTASADGDADTVRAAAALGAALDEIARLERIMSSWLEESELSRLNRSAATTPVACSADLAAVLDSSLALARLTGGAFDPTVEPLVRAWDLRGEGKVPGAKALAVARAAVGWRGLALDPDRRTARFDRAGMGVDLGGIGKGYALDRAGETLRRHGTRTALVNLGGEIGASGDLARAVTIAHPQRRLSPAVEIAVANAAVSTSGQSERGFTAGGVRHGHILDPRSGRPVPTEASVTVICASGTRADALSTALLVMGREGAGRFARAHGEVGVLWLEPDGPAVRAWRWNVPGARAVEGAAVRWMDEANP